MLIHVADNVRLSHTCALPGLLQRSKSGGTNEEREKLSLLCNAVSISCLCWMLCKFSAVHLCHIVRYQHNY